MTGNPFEKYGYPCCYACHLRGSADVHFMLVATEDGRWRHACGAIVCAACGAEPTAGDVFCQDCRALMGDRAPLANARAA